LTNPNINPCGQAPDPTVPAAPVACCGQDALGQRVFGQLALRLGDIDIWVAVVGEAPDADLAAQFEQVLTGDERERHGKFVFEKDRRRYLVTRSLVRYVLSRYVPIRPADWRFKVTAFGRPFIINPHPAVSGLTFNISHSDQVALLGVTREGRLGIDIEDLRRNVPLDIAGSFFSSGEVRQLRSLPIASQPPRFLDFWTLKESYIKARGEGLSLPLDKFGFDLSGEGVLQAYFDASLNDLPVNWTFWQWRPTADSLRRFASKTGPASRDALRFGGPFLGFTKRRWCSKCCEDPRHEEKDRLPIFPDRVRSIIGWAGVCTSRIRHSA
jgi:4'-phosphopantetheinyl transferase